MPIRGGERIVMAEPPLLEEGACAMRSRGTPPNASLVDSSCVDREEDFDDLANPSSLRSESSCAWPGRESSNGDSFPRSPEPGDSPLTLSPCSSLLIDLEISARSIVLPAPNSDMCCLEPHPKPQEADTDLAAILIEVQVQLNESTPPSRSTTPGLDTVSFASLEANASRAGGLDQGKQPWRKYWPPIPGSPLHKRLASHRPDVAFFSFDPRNHLAHQRHPWQAWKDEDPIPINADLDEEDLWDGELPSPRDLAPHIPSRSDIQPAIQALDRLIQDLDLQAVIPEEFNYLRPLQRYETERPYRLQLPPGLIPMPTTNVATRSYKPIKVYDIHGHEDKFSLDISGFQFFKCGVSVGEWNDHAITQTYLPALCDWVVPLLGGDSGMVYSFNFRHHSDSFASVQRSWGSATNVKISKALDSKDEEEIHDKDDGDEVNAYSMKRFLSDRSENPFDVIAEVKTNPKGPCHWKKPLFRVHCDASHSTYKHRLPMFCPDDADELMKGRVRLVSVWRTLSPYRQDTPLALCDARSVDPGDLVPMDIVYPHFADEVYEVRQSANHRWFYNSGMTTDDVVIFKLSDTHAKDSICPHTAFIDPEVPEGTPPRCSIEVKMMIFGGEPNG